MRPSRTRREMLGDRAARRVARIRYADDFRKASARNAAVLARAAERGFGS